LLEFSAAFWPPNIQLASAHQVLHGALFGVFSNRSPAANYLKAIFSGVL
jgi:hypothetical protein